MTEEVISADSVGWRRGLDHANTVVKAAIAPKPTVALRLEQSSLTVETRADKLNESLLGELYQLKILY
jgi:hypothetical protein